MAGNLILAECNSCDAVAPAEALAQYTAVLNPKLGATERITFARCRQCESPVLVGQEYFGSDEGRKMWSDPYRLYPSREEFGTTNLPRSVRAAHDEAKSCYKAQAFSAATMMCGRTIESALADQRVQFDTLAGGIAELRSHGLIDSRLHEWAEAVPQLSRRFDTDASRDDARDVLEFTEALLAYLYGVRARFNDFRARQTQRAQEPRPLQSTDPTLAAVAAGAAQPPPTGEVRTNGDRPT